MTACHSGIAAFDSIASAFDLQGTGSFRDYYVVSCIYFLPRAFDAAGNPSLGCISSFRWPLHRRGMRRSALLNGFGDLAAAIPASLVGHSIACKALDAGAIGEG